MVKVLAISLVLLTSCTDAKMQEGHLHEPSCAKLRAAHKYHGILYSYQERNGQWYFNRDGKKCKLFNYLKDRRASNE